MLLVIIFLLMFIVRQLKDILGYLFSSFPIKVKYTSKLATELLVADNKTCKKKRLYNTIILHHEQLN